MIKKLSVILIALAFTLTISLAGIPKTAYAYQSSSYYSDVRIGLKSISSAALTVALNGQYVLNNQVLSGSTSFTLTLVNGKILYNGISYDSLTFVPQSRTNTIQISSGTIVRKYLGSMTFKILYGVIVPVNTLNIEDYLKGVVGLEMSNYFPLDALKAQAIAARNYTLITLGKYNSDGYDLTDTTECQSYGGYNGNDTNVINAVDQTRGEVQVYSNNLVQALYSSSDGGYTEANQNVWANVPQPYLIEKPDPYESENWPGGSIIMTNTQIDTVLKSKGYLLSTDSFVNIDLSTITRYQSGRVSNIDVVYKDMYGNIKRKSFTANSARTFLGFPSSLYTVFYDSVYGKYTFTGKGNGHGIGMSQMGAKYRAAAGQSYRTILNFYYDGSYTQNLLPSIASFAEDKTSIISGQAINFSASGSEGSGSGYLFKYVITKNGSTVYTQNYSSTGTLSYTPLSSGNYTVILYLKDALSQADYDSQSTLNFTAYAAPQITSTVLSGTMYEKKSVNLSITTSGGSGNILYQYDLYKNGVYVSTRAFAPGTSYSFTPSSSGSYMIKTYAKDSMSSKIYDSTKNTYMTIQKEPVVVSQLPIYWGMKGTDVVQIQTALANLGYSVGTIDGIFGSKTYTALVLFQKSKLLNPTGAVDQLTLNALNDALIAKATN